MIRKHKQFSWPRSLFDSPRIQAENKLVAKYGLKNKKEIWRTEAKIDYFRGRAKDLSTEDESVQKEFFANLKKLGLKVDSIADVLALEVEDLLRRRFASVVADKKLAKTPREARQMIVHKRVEIDGNLVNSPSYIVRTDEENAINIRKKTKKKIVKENVEEPKENEEVKEDKE